MQKHSEHGVDSSFGWLGFIGDTVDTITAPIGDALKPVGKFLQGGPVGDFFNSAAGKVILTAVTSGAYGALAPTVGPQLAGVAFGLPGVVKGDDFAKGWMKEFVDRVGAVIQYLAPDVGNQIAGSISSALGPLGDTLKNMLPDINDATAKAGVSLTDYAQKNLGLPKDIDTSSIARRIGLPSNASIADIAKKTGIPALSVPTFASRVATRQDVVAYVKSQALRLHIPSGMIVDPLSGLVTMAPGTANADSRAIGIPENGFIPSDYPNDGSRAWIKETPVLRTNSNVAWPIGTQVTITRNVSLNYPFSSYSPWYQVQDGKGNLGVVSYKILSATPPPPPPLYTTAQGALAAVKLNPNKTIVLTPANMEALNTLLNFMKKDRKLVIAAPMAVAKWLRDHGISATSAPYLYDLTSAVKLNPNGSIVLTPQNMNDLNQALNILKLDKSATISVPPPLVKWFMDHGIPASRVPALQQWQSDAQVAAKVAAMNPAITSSVDAIQAAAMIQRAAGQKVTVPGAVSESLWHKILHFLGLA